MQHKLIDLDQIDVKFDDARRGFFSGYASKFGGVDAYGDTVFPGAYLNTLEMRKRPVQMRFNHFSGVIGKWLNIRETEEGLWVEGELTQGHSLAEDVYASMKHGAISGLSIGYRPVKSFPNETGGLDLHEIDLVEISIVESPADLAAEIGDVKSAIDATKSYKELESILRESGWSKSNATWFVEHCKRLGFGEQGKEEEVIEVPFNVSADEIALAFKLHSMRNSK